MIAKYIKFFLPAGSSIMLLSGCFIADDIFIEPEPPKPPSLQKSCEEAVELYIRERAGTKTYRPYGYTQVVIQVPQELINLEEMEQDRELGFGEGAKTDSIIAARRLYVETNNIQRTATIEHFFTLKDANGYLEVLEVKYVLNDTFAVIDFEPITMLRISDYYEQAVSFFFHRYNLFSSPDINEARKLSNAFYSFFYNQLDREEGVDARSAFYFNCLKITEEVRATGVFDANRIAQLLAKDALVNSVPSTVQLISLQFSPLYEKSSENAIQGYYIFYKFSQVTNGVTDTAAMRFDFTPYYEIESKTLLDPPFDNYFN